MACSKKATVFVHVVQVGPAKRSLFGGRRGLFKKTVRKFENTDLLFEK